MTIESQIAALDREDLELIKEKCNDKINVLAETENENFRAVILSEPVYYHRVVFIEKVTGKVSPALIWQDIWEPDQNISEEDYLKLSKEKRANIEVELQLKKWCEKAFK